MKENRNDPYEEFFMWCDSHGFKDVSGPVEKMTPRRLDAAIAAYVSSGGAEPSERLEDTVATGK